MCGFVGGTDPSWDYTAALASIEHRGPDDGRLHLEGPVRVGFRRLSIIDLDAAAMQPMVADDGETWSEWGTVEIAQATALATYAGIDIALGGIVAQHVRMTALSNYSLLGLTQVGLAEIRFYNIPVASRELAPAHGSTVTGLTADLSWRSGRYTAEHQILFSSDLAAIEDGSAVIATTPDRSLTVEDLALNGSYFWQIVDVTAEAVWETVGPMVSVQFDYRVLDKGPLIADPTADPIELYDEREGAVEEARAIVQGALEGV